MSVMEDRFTTTTGCTDIVHSVSLASLGVSFFQQYAPSIKGTPCRILPTAPRNPHLCFGWELSSGLGCSGGPMQVISLGPNPLAASFSHHQDGLNCLPQSLTVAPKSFLKSIGRWRSHKPTLTRQTLVFQPAALFLLPAFHSKTSHVHRPLHWCSPMIPRALWCKLASMKGTRGQSLAWG